MIIEHRGVLTGYFETGLEGVMWAMHIDGLKGYDALEILEAGDYLEIYSEEGEIVFSGVIKPDKTIGRMPHFFSDRTQPSALGLWIHWTQEGFKSDDWAMYFMTEEYTGMLRREVED